MTKNTVRSKSARVREAKETGFDVALDAYPTIVEALVKQAEQGSVPHAKLVFELLEFCSASKRQEDEEEPSGPSLAEYLIEQLQLQPPPEGAPGTTSEDSSAA